MAREVRSFTVTVPIGVAKASPQTFDVSFPPREVERIEVKVPKGPRGQMGFYIANSKQQVIPFNIGEWLVLDDDDLAWDLENQVNSGSWQVVAYNTGLFQHSLWVRFLLGLVSQPAPRPLSLYPRSALSTLGP